MTSALKAFVDEINCIGCHKCTRVCPTDAIVGSKRFLHTILPEWCTSCEKCISVCPTNCISLSTPGLAMSSDQEEKLTQQKLIRQQEIRPHHPQDAVATIWMPQTTDAAKSTAVTLDVRKQNVADAIERAKARRLALQQKNKQDK